MTDRISSARRSWNMSRIKGKDTCPEIVVRSILHRLGYRFRLHRKDLPGKPDIVLPKHETVIFVNGCFWHRHTGCRQATTPKSNTAFWKKKFADTIKRDRKQQRLLKEAGWRVLVLWECQINDSDDSISRIDTLMRSRSQMEIE